MVRIFSYEISTNGRDSTIKSVDSDMILPKDSIDSFRKVLIEGYSKRLKRDVYVYLHYKELPELDN